MTTSRESALWSVKSLTEEWGEVRQRFNLPQKQVLSMVMQFGSPAVHDAMCAGFSATRAGYVETADELAAFMRGFLLGRQRG
jgi:hypothetical protein